MELRWRFRNRQLFCLFLIFILVQLPHFSFAQASGSVTHGIFRIKVSEGMSQQLSRLAHQKNSINVDNTGNGRLDIMNKRFNVLSIRRVFPYSEKYEARHRKYGLHRWYEVQVGNSTNIHEAIRGYRAMDELDVVEPVYTKNIIGADNHPEVLMSHDLTLLGSSNDPMLASQWHYENTGQTGGTPGADIDLINAWAIEAGKPNVVVAIVDGGIDLNHEDLQANLWVNSNEIAGNDLDDDNNGYIDDLHGYSFVDNTGDILAFNHGTHVAGTVGAVNHNSIGVAGVAGGSGRGDGVRIMSCAVFSNVGGADGFAEGFVYAADNGAVISQNSWSYDTPDVYEQVILDGIDYFINEAGKDLSGNQTGPMMGGMVFFATGNGNSSAHYYPAFYEPVFSVASTNHLDVRSWYSNYGDWVDISAPGGDGSYTQGVLSTLNNNQYGFYQGTSMACPHVSGIAALAVSKYGGPGFTPEKLRTILVQSADNIDAENPSFLGLLGAGRVNAFKALSFNFLPVINGPSEITVIETTTRELVITAFDEDDTDINLDLIDPPAFVSLIQRENARLVCTIRPGINDYGQYQLTVQAMDSKNGITLSTILVHVTRYGVENFTIVDKRDGRLIATFQESIILNKADAAFPYYIIQANTNPAVVGSVHFVIDDRNKKEVFTPPYSIPANEVRTMKTGDHTIDATAYTVRSNKGIAGGTAQALITIVNEPTQGSALSNIASLTLSPNPVNDELRVKLGDEVKGSGELIILDATGYPVYRIEISTDQTTDLKVNMSGLASGLYYVQVTDQEGQRVTSRIVKR